MWLVLAVSPCTRLPRRSAYRRATTDAQALLRRLEAQAVLPPAKRSSFSRGRNYIEKDIRPLRSMLSSATSRGTKERPAFRLG